MVNLWLMSVSLDQTCSILSLIVEASSSSSATNKQQSPGKPKDIDLVVERENTRRLLNKEFDIVKNKLWKFAHQTALELRRTKEVGRAPTPTAHAKCAPLRVVALQQCGRICGPSALSASLAAVWMAS